VHGGIGFTWEHDVHLFLKRAQLDQLAFGDAVVHRTRLTQLLRPRVEAGESVL
jgi:alkylation response protein AidB-like acyl-CoA dehydrogenase